MLKQTYKKMDSHRDLCTGCGADANLEHSHIIPRSKRRDLVAEIDNITFHCNSCHTKWESHDISIMAELNDFDKNMEYIKKVDVQYYNLLMKNVND